MMAKRAAIRFQPHLKELVPSDQLHRVSAHS